MPQSDQPSPLYRPVSSLPQPWLPAPEELRAIGASEISVGKTEPVVDTRRVASLIEDAMRAKTDDDRRQLLQEALDLLDE